MSYDPDQASLQAINLVSTALQSGSITLHGAHKTHLASTEAAAVADAKYLGKLITDLTAAIQKLP